MVLKNLFGGAISAEIPSGLIDASDFRQVPDSQEVFLYPGSHVSIVIEVLERISESIDTEAVKFHFEALAHDNEAIWSTVVEPPFVLHNDRADQTPPPIFLRGSQRICKFNSIAAHDVDILLALFRVHFGRKSADLVVSANISRSSEGGVGKEHAVAIASEFHTLITSLRIVDYDLFC